MAYGGGRRLAGRALLGGFGLLGLAVTLGIIVVLAVRALDSSPVTATDPTPVTDRLGGPEQVVSPGAPTPPQLPGPDAARQAACGTNRSTLELASAAYAALNGSAPADQAALVDAGLLDAEVTTHHLEPSGTAAVIIGLGDCADP